MQKFASKSTMPSPKKEEAKFGHSMSLKLNLGASKKSLKAENTRYEQAMEGSKTNRSSTGSNFVKKSTTNLAKIKTKDSNPKKVSRKVSPSTSQMSIQKVGAYDKTLKNFGAKGSSQLSTPR